MKGTGSGGHGLPPEQAVLPRAQTLDRAGAVKVLLADTNRWALSARLAISLMEVGCEVSAVCPSQAHPLKKTRSIRRIFRYSGVHPVHSLNSAIKLADPDIVVPCCDRSVEHLHELYSRAQSRGGAGAATIALIERSLGPRQSHSIVSSRSELLEIAGQEGIRTPHTCRANSHQDVAAWCAQEPFPWVLKVDGTWGGLGVRVIQSQESIERSFSEINRLFRLSRAVKRLIVNRDSFWLRTCWSRPHYGVVAQSFIAGRPANCAVVCWQGRVLGIICVEVVRSDGPTGPANMVRVVENGEMRFAAERLAARLGLSGFFGLDFIIEERTSAAYLIEMNPRTTPPCHFRLGSGRDLVGGLWSQLAGRPADERQPTTSNDLIAYFPQSANSKPATLERCYYDIPTGEPDLVEELMHPFPDRTFMFRLVQKLTRNQSAIDASEVR